MQISSAIAQLRTTDLAESIRFYTTKLGLTLEFRYQDFYAGIRAGSQLFHLKLSDEKDPSIEFVEKGEHFHLYLRNGRCLGRGGRVEEERSASCEGRTRDALGNTRVRHRGRSGAHVVLR